ncbi:MAG: phage gp6-like head-tail connector protein [Lacticaseibacillus songhuajiangensis]|jgi:hypothetical protein|nr:phage gp6-like head-tail connector protein [Lacticaseibacillus songhuajiangensis]
MAETSTADLVAKLKLHLQWEEDMDDTMYPSYIEAAKQYVIRALDEPDEQLVIMVASILADWRVPDKDMAAALESLTPFFIQIQFAQLVGDDDEAD